METCEVDGCTRLGHRRRALDQRVICNMHLDRWRRHGSFETLRPRDRVCEVGGCDQKHNQHGYCSRHAASFMAYGDPLTAREQSDGKCRLCYRRHHALGLCAMHYHRWLKWDDPLFDGQNYIECAVEGCFIEAVGRGYCTSHYRRLREYGDPLGGEGGLMGVDMPVGPLLSAIASRGGLSAVLANCGVLHGTDEFDRIARRIDRGRCRGVVDLSLADEFCCRFLNTHPALVWGEGYWCEEDEREELAA